VKGGYKQEKKNSQVPSLCVAEGLCCAVQSLWPSLSLDHGWALKGEDGHLCQEGGLRIGERGELLSEIANEKKRYVP
jgi:hypothetical protein